MSCYVYDIIMTSPDIKTEKIRSVKPHKSYYWNKEKRNCFSEKYCFFPKNTLIWDIFQTNYQAALSILAEFPEGYLFIMKISTQHK